MKVACIIAIVLVCATCTFGRGSQMQRVPGPIRPELEQDKDKQSVSLGNYLRVRDFGKQVRKATQPTSAQPDVADAQSAENSLSPEVSSQDDDVSKEVVSDSDAAKANQALPKQSDKRSSMDWWLSTME